MENFVKQVSKLDLTENHGVLAAAYVSSQFVAIHPFSDGNGRMSRLLMNWCLNQAGYPFALCLNLAQSRYRSRYYQAMGHAFQYGKRHLLEYEILRSLLKQIHNFEKLKALETDS